MTTTFFNHLPTQLSELQRKHLADLKEINRLQLHIAKLEAQAIILEIEVRRLRVALASPRVVERNSLQ